MSTKIAGVTVSAKIKNERVTVQVRKTTIHSMEFWASDFPFDEHIIDQKNWMALQMETDCGKLDKREDHLDHVTPDGWRIIEAAIKEINTLLAEPVTQDELECA